jgi:hypothetical protein
LRYKIMGKICEQFLAGPRPDVNYGELTSLLPGLRADLEFIDKGIFKELLPGVFATLKKDPKRKVLILSSAEKQQLIDHITSKSNGMRGLVS